jgi:acetylornithine deacetylase/succinyl-diaminopimelate desuccinylase-like protein
MDVVGVGDRAKWGRDPFAAEVADGILHGRGSADSKGMLAGMLAAVRAFRAAGVTPRGDLYLVAYADDETAGPCGLRDAYRAGLVGAEQLVLGEATAFEIQHVFKARLWFSVEALGKTSHGAFPERGVNAIDKAYSVIDAVRRIPLLAHPALGSDSVSIGMIRGGEQVNVVAGECRVWFDVRFGPPRKADEIRAEVERVLRELEAGDPELALGPIEVTEERDPLEFAPDSPLNAAIKAAGRVALGREPGLGGWYSSGELWPVWNQGLIRSGAVIGPGEPWQAHAYDEQLPVADLVDGARLYALTALNVCGAE